MKKEKFYFITAVKSGLYNTIILIYVSLRIDYM